MHTRPRPHVDLVELARRVLRESGFATDFTPQVENEVQRLAHAPAEDLQDQRTLPWCSIDNDDSRDLDQLTCCERLSDGRIRVHVAVADVDTLAPRGGAIDRHARQNTTSIYTPARVFPMLPERLSTDLTSLNEGVDRPAIVTSFSVSPTGDVESGEPVRALVRNHAKLAYRSVGAWLADIGPAPAKVAANAVLQRQLRDQDEAAQALRHRRHERGALALESIEARAVVRDGRPVDLRREAKDRAKELIEDFMVAANATIARFLARRGLPAIRRVVREPERWDRIVELAARHNATLPIAPDARALAAFLDQRRRADPLRFPDLSLTVVKLMGNGEYVMERPSERIGHFALAVRHYAHSTAPNRRYPDLITQRMVKAALAGRKPAYDEQELAEVAAHCSEQEDNADKVERRLRKSAAALLLADRIGSRFDAIVTGAKPKGTWVRVLHPPVEGRVVRGERGVDVGDQVRVELVSTDVENGFIDFAIV